MPKFSTPTTFADLLSGACDPLGLLSNVKPAAPKAKPRSVVEINFQAIIEFYEKHHRVPDLNAADFAKDSWPLALLPIGLEMSSKNRLSNWIPLVC